MPAQLPPGSASGAARSLTTICDMAAAVGCRLMFDQELERFQPDIVLAHGSQPFGAHEN
jgi:hypothetical protein